MLVCVYLSINRIHFNFFSFAHQTPKCKVENNSKKKRKKKQVNFFYIKYLKDFFENSCKKKLRNITFKKKELDSKIILSAKRKVLIA